MDDYLSKPVKLSSLREVLLRYCVSVQPDTGVRPEAVPSSTDAGDAVAEAPILDTEHVIECTGGDVEMIESMIAMALEDLESQINELARAPVSGETDWAGLAHAVKGAAAMVGAARLSAVAARIEQAAGAGDEQGMAQNAACLKGEFEQFRKAAQQMDWQAAV
jgi:HPt (histidine-containing phosphotransfer) domain-containing protein